eukprot:COSAG06_NODE_8140_length_2261_cov_1.926920_1_plen_118_part_00
MLRFQHAGADAERARCLCRDAEHLTGWTGLLATGKSSNWLAAISPACDELRCRLAHGLWREEEEEEAGSVRGKSFSYKTLSMMEELSRKLEVELASIFCRALAGGVETSFLQCHFIL